MRKIKFRGKRLDGIWEYGFYFEEQMQNGTKCYIQDENVTVKPFEVIPESVGQSTELFDENDKEIYEGDIVEWVFFSQKIVYGDDTTIKGVIEWQNGGFILRVIENDFEDAGWYGISELNSDTESDVTVLGNIHDNPELLKSL